VTPRLFVGVTNQHARERLRTSIVAVPEGVDPERLSRLGPTDQVHSRNLGGLALGAGVSIALTRHLAMAPDVRYDYGSIGDEINNAWRASLRTVWNF
jgi:opacity protein-like surface antigen